MQNNDHTTTGASADADLILRTRSGDADAFGELWRRHYPSGMSVARSITSTIDADDLVQEAYTRIYQAIIKGGGPNGSFRAYLFTSIRNTAAAWGRSRRETAMDELDTVADPDSTEQAADEALDRSLTAQAFRGLPTRWQEVLWYTEIEQMKPAEVAPLLGMKSGAVSQLAFRAREGLREAWIQAHLRSAEPGSECQWTIEHLGAYSRGNLSTRDQKRLDVHIEDCARCMIVVGEAKDVSNRLALVLLPLVLGIAGAAGYTATLQAGGAPIIALAAMPSSVVEGAVVVGGTGASAAAAGLAGKGSGSAAAGTATAGSTATGTAAVSGIGALVGAGSAALVVAGVVAAATIVPGLVDANPMSSMPSASEVGDSSISSELTPDAELNDEKFILEIPDEKPKTPDDVDQTPDVKVPVNDVAPTAETTPPVVTTTDGDGSGGDSDPATEDPGTEDPGTEDPGTEDPGTEDPGTEDPGTEDPGTEDPGTEDPGTEDPGTEDPGTEDPGTEDPGTEDPGTEDPGTEDPGTEDPGTEDPGTEDPGTEEPGTEEPGTEEPGTEEPTEPTDPGDPAGPTEAVSITGTTLDLEGTILHVRVAIQGVPNATVQALINGSSGGADQIILDNNGAGVIDLRPTGLNIILNARVTIQYLTENGAEYPLNTSLWRLGATQDSAASVDPDGTAPADVVEEPVVEEPVVEEPVVEEPVVEEPVVEEPVVEEPVVEEPVVEEPVVEEPVVEEPVVEEPVVEEPVVEEPVVEEPVVEEPVVEEPAVDGTIPTEDPAPAE